MNGKKARALRRRAESDTIGMPMARMKKGHCPPSFLAKKTKQGLTVGHIKVADGVPQEMIPGCTKKVYRNLKTGVEHETKQP